MKKISFTKILTVVLVCAALIGAVVGINASAADEKSVEIVSNNVWYGDTLRLAYAVKCDADVEVTVYLDEACTVEWCKATEADDTVTINGVECKKFYSDKGVPVQNMNTYLYAKAVNLENSEEDVQRYSVLEYLYERLYVSENVSESQEKLYDAQLAYAKAAEKVLYEDKNVERPDYTNPVEGYNYVRVTNGTIDGVYSAGVYANDSTPFEGGEMTYYIDGEQPENTELKWVIGGSSLTSDELKAVVADRTIIVEAIYEEIVASGQVVTATLTFDDAAKRTSFSTDSQTWVENNITFINNKASSSNNVANYSEPVRLYANSSVTVQVEGTITEIVFDCNNSTYATALKNSIGDAATASSDKVTVTLSDGVDSSFTIDKLTAQVRVDAITVTYTTK